MYKIVRSYLLQPTRTIKTGLTLQEAQAHCKSPNASSQTNTTTAGKKRTALKGPWFDGYDQCTK